jgi:hypothetical protein
MGAGMDIDDRNGVFMPGKDSGRARRVNSVFPQSRGWSNMFKHISRFVLTMALMSSAQLFACDKDVPCDKCMKESEFSWNPGNQFVSARLSRFYRMEDEITAAYKANDFGKVKELAKENLELASVYRCNWNYGNAVHDTNRMLGLVSLKSGEVDAAADYLLKAGKSTGSPQLDTFGPELDLANELLKRGKVDAVKTYLTDIKSFWEMNRGQIDAWLFEIEKGGKPELERFAANRPGPLLVFLFWLMTAWPLILSTTFLYAKRSRINRKAVYFMVAALSGYALMFLVNWLAGYIIQATLSDMDYPGQMVIFLIGYLPLGLAFLLPVLAILYQARFFQSGVSKKI